MTYQTTIVCQGCDDADLPAEVDFDYQPAERQTMYDPGCPEDVEITDIRVDACPKCGWKLDPAAKGLEQFYDDLEKEILKSRRD